MRRELVLTHRAEADLREIWVYSFENWGIQQADRYLDLLGEALQQCGANPDRGKKRGELRPGYRSLLIRKHVIFYTFNDDEVLIQRVLHSSMEPHRHVDE